MMDFTATKQAVKRHEKRQVILDKIYDCINSQRDVKLWSEMQKLSDKVLRQVFYYDTKDFNTYENCKLVSVFWIASLMSKEGGK